MDRVPNKLNEITNVPAYTKDQSQGEAKGDMGKMLGGVMQSISRSQRILKSNWGFVPLSHWAFTADSTTLGAVQTAVKTIPSL